MKISKEGNKIILELEPEDAGPVPIEEVVEVFYTGFKMMLENPELMMEELKNYMAIVPDQVKASGDLRSAS